MPLDALLKRIEADGEVEAARIVERSRVQAGQTLEKARARAEAEASAILRKAESDAREVVRRAEVQASLEARRIMLAAKQAQIDAVFAKAVRDVVDLPRERYAEFLTRLIQEGAERGDEEVAVAARDREVAASTVIPEVNRRLAASGKKGALTLSQEPAPIEGGAILRTERSVTNSSVEALVRKYREELEAEVASILFGTGQER